MSEVLTDNDPRVANILAEYEVRETEEQQPETSQDQSDEKRGEKKKKKPVLREIKNGRVSKKSKGGRRKVD